MVSATGRTNGDGRGRGHLFRAALRLTSVAACLLLAAAPAYAASSVSVTAKAAGKTYALPYVGDMKTHMTVYEDTMVALARDNDIGFVEMRSANPFVDPWLPGAGIDMILPTRHLLPKAPHEGIVINLPDMRLYAYADKSKPPLTFPIGVGRTGLSTPVGETKVVRKVMGPIWRPTPRMREEKPELPEAVRPGMDNPMGTHAMYLGWTEYAIHGTNKPYGIGRRSSSGCIRLYPEDIITLFDATPEGTKVTVVNQPVKAAWIDDTLYVEAHTPLDQIDKIEQDGGYPDYVMNPQDMQRIVDEAGPYASNIDWNVVRKLMRERPGYPVAVATRPSSASATGDEKAVRDEQPKRS
jgi:L,D-transpeptidase ErfK/SrfK